MVSKKLVRQKLVSTITIIIDYRDFRTKTGGVSHVQGSLADQQFSLPAAVSNTPGVHTSHTDSKATEGPPPELRSTYHDSFGGSGGFMAPLRRMQNTGKQVQLVNPVPPAPRENNYSMAEQSRINSLEDRLINQERASQNILGETSVELSFSRTAHINLLNSKQYVLILTLIYMNHTYLPKRYRNFSPVSLCGQLEIST